MASQSAAPGTIPGAAHSNVPLYTHRWVRVEGRAQWAVGSGPWADSVQFSAASFGAAGLPTAYRPLPTALRIRPTRGWAADHWGRRAEAGRPRRVPASGRGAPARSSRVRSEAGSRSD